MTRIDVKVGELLFEFSSFDDWCDRAQILFRNHGHDSRSAMCVDSDGLICTRGKQFAEAVFPVRVYAIDDPPFKPCGMLGGKVPIEGNGEHDGEAA